MKIQLREMGTFLDILFFYGKCGMLICARNRE